MRVRKPSPGFVIAVVALFIALGGTAFASHFLITSTNQIKPSVLKKLQGKTGRPGAKGVTGAAGAQGKEGPVGRDGKDGAAGIGGPTGPAGKEGTPGKEGKEGPPGPSQLTHLEVVRSEEEIVEPEEANAAVALCPAGSKPVSGGFREEGPPPVEQFSEAVEFEQEGEIVHGWAYGSSNPDKNEFESIEAVAYCASEGKAIATAAPAPKLQQEVKAAVLAKAKARHAQRAR
jgi:Collagen triple helix repeat (20 copies)